MTLTSLFILLAFIFIGIPVMIIVGIVALVKYEKSHKRPNQYTVYGPPYIPPKKPREKLPASSIMLIIGTIFIMLSAVAFVCANWLKMESIGRVFTIAGASVIAFVISAVMKVVAKLDRTSSAFYMIGTLVGLVSFGTAGYYELFGEWFSFNGLGYGMFLAIMAGIASVSAFAGYNFYKHNSFNYCGFAFVAIGLAYLCLQICISLEADTDMYCLLIAIVQLIITAVVHIYKPQKGTIYEKSARIMADITAVFYQVIALTYVVFTTFEPTWFTFGILVILLAQLILYGILKNQRWMFIFADIAGIYTALIISGCIDNEGNEPLAMFVFGIFTLAIYLVNLAISENLTSAKIISLVGLVIGAIVCLNADSRDLFFLNLLIPASVVAINVYYCMHKSRDIQFFAGIALPIMPLCMAYVTYDTFHNGRNSDELTTLVYGGLALLYILISAFFIYLPDFAFDFYTRHTTKAHTAEYACMIAGCFSLFAISSYSELFLISVLLCIAHFAVSYSMRCNVTAIGSVIAFIILVKNILEKFIENENIQSYIVFGVFAILILVSRFVFPNAVAYQENGRTKIDVALLSCWITLIDIPGDYNVTRFLTMISIAIFITGFVKKNTNKNATAVLLSISALIGAFALVERPFLDFDSYVITSKINLAIFVLLGASYRFIWRNHGEFARTISTVVFVLSFSGLIFDGIVNEFMANRIFVLAVTAGILVFSFYAKSKTWFTASSIALVILTVLLTARYISTAGWWIYLLAVGVVFIVIATINEACKKKGETMKETVTKTFEDWTW